MNEIKDSILVDWELSRKISARLYFDWIKKHGLTQMFNSPETLPSIFYQKNWAETSIELVEGIFNYLSSYNILVDAGGTYSLNDNYEYVLNNITEEIGRNYESHLTTKFIQHGLKIVDLKLDGDAGYWDLIQNGYLFDRGLTQKPFQAFCYFSREYIRTKIELDQSPKNYMYYSPFIACSLIKMASSLQQFKDFGFFVPTKQHKRQFIAFCELNKTTSKYSPYVFVDKEYQEDKKFDIIWVPMILGFYGSIKDQIKFIRNLSNQGSIQFWYSPIDSKHQLGLELLFKMHPEFDQSYSSSNYRKALISNGFSEITRIGHNNSILVTTRS